VNSRIEQINEDRKKNISSLKDLNTAEVLAIMIGMLTYLGDGKVSKEEQDQIAIIVSLPIFDDANIYHRDKKDRELTNLERVVWVLQITKNVLPNLEITDSEALSLFKTLSKIYKKKLRKGNSKKYAKEMIPYTFGLLTDLAEIDGLEKKEKKFLRIFKKTGGSSVWRFLRTLLIGFGILLVSVIIIVLIR
jgi:hypothetical protein